MNTVVRLSTLRSMTLLVIATVALAACNQGPGQNVYRRGDLNQNQIAEIGIVGAVREVTIEGDGGLGAVAGGVAGGFGGGALARSMGGGMNSQLFGTVGGLIAGMVAGAAANEALVRGKGIEYTITMQSGLVRTIVQEVRDGERVFSPGDRVVVQIRGDTQRVLPADGVVVPQQAPTINLQERIR